MAVSLEKLMAIKKQISEIRDSGIKARATMEEVENNIANLEKELKELGINNTDDVLSEIKAMEDEAEEIYNQIKEKMNKFM